MNKINISNIDTDAVRRVAQVMQGTIEFMLEHKFSFKEMYMVALNIMMNISMNSCDLDREKAISEMRSCVDQYLSSFANQDGITFLTPKGGAQ